MLSFCFGLRREIPCLSGLVCCGAGGHARTAISNAQPPPEQQECGGFVSLTRLFLKRTRFHPRSVAYGESGRSLPFKSFLAASGKRPPSCSLLFLYLFITSHISFSPFHNAHTDGQGLMPGTSISPWLGAGYWGWRRRRWWRRERHLLLKDKDE